MQSHGEQKPTHQTGGRDKALLIYWIVIGIGIGVVIGASTKDWVSSLISGLVMGIGMGLFATKSGADH